MEYYGRNTQKNTRSVITIGTFDGVHRGHLTILSKVVERARDSDGVPSVITFEPHPREIIVGEIVPLLTTIPERIDLLQRSGIERTVVVPFDTDFASLSAEDYVRTVLFDNVGLQEVVVGHDHAFGKGRTGNLRLLEDLAEELGFRVTSLPAVRTDRTIISSSMIRQLLLLEGEVEKAAAALGRYYSITGLVVPGDGRGTSLGFPTANIAVGHSRKIIPLRGVYAVRTCIDQSAEYYSGMMNIGFRPTFDGSGLRVEVHLFDFGEDLYGRTLQIEFVKRIRDERKFDGIGALREQLKEDRLRCTEALAAVS